jgi:hypothetical protein
MMACMSLVQYSSAFSFLSFYIADPAIRGQGIGYELWKTALAPATAGTIGLDGVVDQQDNYRKSGFTLAHRNLRYGGVPTGLSSDPDWLTTVTAGHLDAIAAYDRTCFPAARRAFLEFWLTSPGHLGVVSHSEEHLEGYGAIRPSRDGHKIGPLFSDTPAIAANIFDALVRRSGCESVCVDPPEPNAPAIELCRKRGLSPVFETARMYRGPAPELSLSQIYGITSFELG